jgi:hypothetical protein
MTTFTISRELDLPSEKAFAIISDFTRSPSPNIAVTVEKKGDPASNGVGTIRTITIGKVRVRERLESVTPPNSFTYSILLGAPMKDYLGNVEIAPQEAKSIVRWNVKFTPKIPGTGWIGAIVSRKTINRLIDEMEMSNR